MKVCLITTFPPSRGGLSEYGFHIAQELQQHPFLSLAVLADESSDEPPAPEPDGFYIVRCWKFNDFKSPIRLLREIRKFNPDVVWFNLLFTTFGENPLVAFWGLITPFLTRLAGYYSHVTLHHLMDTVDLHDAGVRFPRLYRLAGAVATRMLLMANSITVLMPAYRKILVEKYGGKNVHLGAHGILSQKPELPDLSQRGNPHTILAFGKWGTYKRLETLLEAFSSIAAEVPNVRLVIAGGDHPRTPGYVDSVEKAFGGNPQIHFTGYVAEEKIPGLFKNASVVVMPYSSSTGASGVAHIACAYGLPIISADLPDFREMAEEEGLAMDFYPSGSPAGLAHCLTTLLQSPSQQYQMAVQNFSAALRMTMPQVIQDYLHRFDLEQHTKALRTALRARSLPRWIPSNPLVEWASEHQLLRWPRRLRFAAKTRNGYSAAISGADHNEAAMDDLAFPPQNNIEEWPQAQSGRVRHVS